MPNAGRSVVVAVRAVGPAPVAALAGAGPGATAARRATASPRTQMGCQAFMSLAMGVMLVLMT